MGRDFFRQPAKQLDREFRALGAKRLDRSSAGVRYEFPDGAVYLIPEGVSPGKAMRIFQGVTTRYGEAQRRIAGNPLRSAVQRANAPTVTADRIVMSHHANARITLMRSQARLDRREIADAMTFPERVLWSPLHESWMWVRGRIIVTAAVHEDESIVVRTILWATEDLWEQNPRPKGTP